MSKILANLRLRTKLLCSLVLVVTALTCATLLVVRRTAQVQAQGELEAEGRNTILTFKVLQQEHQIALSRKAELLAELAFIRNGDPTTIQDASEDPWQSDDCDLFVLADAAGHVVAAHTVTGEFPVSTAEEMLRGSAHSVTGWWYGGNHLYQVVLRPFYEDPPQNKVLSGTVIVGHAIGRRDIDELRRISDSEVALLYRGNVVVSTLAPLKEYEFAQQIHQQPAVQRIQVDDERYLSDSVKLSQSSLPSVNLIILKSYDATVANLNRLNHLLLGLGLAAVVAGSVLIFLISDTFTRPLGKLVGGVRALEKGNFSYPLETAGGDEVAQVTRAFDDMRSSLQRHETQRQRLEDQLRQSQKMEAIGRLAGGVAHDFNNLLTVIKGHSGLMFERLDLSDPLRASSQQIEKAADRAASLTRQLLAFCRMQVLQPKVLDLNALVSDMGKMLQRLIREDIAFTFRPSNALKHVKVDPSQVEQVILNLVVNACDAMPQGGKLLIETHDVIMDEQGLQARPLIQPGRYALLVVSDTGCGMNAETKAHIFEPFFTTKEQGKGTGLGLATVYGVVKQSGGWIWVDSEPGRGARFEIYLPVVEKTEQTTPLTELVTPVSAGNFETVLIAEDEAGVRELASQFLASAGYRVIAAEDGRKALALAEQSGSIHLLLTDVVMPNMRGPELSKRLKRLYPNLKVVYMSGYLEYGMGSDEFLEDSLFLQKPFSREKLIQKIGEALGNRAPGESPVESLQHAS